MKGIGALHLLIGVIALVIGLAVGGLGPRSEARALRAQLDDAAECKDSAMGSEIANVFRGRPWGGDEPRKRVTGTDAGPVPVPIDEKPPAEDPDPDGFRMEWNSDGDEPENMKEGLDLARDAMELRYTQARAALLEDAQPTAEQMEQFDTAMDKMNQDLVGLAEDLVAQVNDGGEPSRHDTMLFAAETLDVLLSAEDNMRDVMSEDQIGSLSDESLDPLSYIDPSIVDVLQTLDR